MLAIQYQYIPELQDLVELPERTQVEVDVQLRLASAHLHLVQFFHPAVHPTRSANYLRANGLLIFHISIME